MHDRGHGEVDDKLAALRQRVRGVDPMELERRRRARRVQARAEMIRAWRMDALLSSLERNLPAQPARPCTILGRSDLVLQLQRELEQAGRLSPGRDNGEGVWV